MQENESVDQILKEIFIKACTEYLEQPKKLNTIDKFTRTYIGDKTGIDKNTLKRYLDPEARSYPNLVEVMEALRVVNKKEYLLDFGKRSNCQAAKFVKEFYPTYINSHQIESEEASEIKSNDEVLRMINEQHNIMDTKILDTSNAIVKSILVVMVIGHLKIIWELMKIQDMLKK